MMKKIIFLLGFFFYGSCFSSWELIGNTFKKLPYGKINFIRSSKSILSQKTKRLSGSFYFKKNQFLIKDRHFIIFDGKNLWIKRAPLKQHLKKFKKIPFKKSSFVLWTLFKNPDHLKKKFRLKRKKSWFVLKPKGKSDFKEIKIQLTKNKIKKISYTDGLGNQTLFKITKTFRKKFKSDFFLKPLNLK